MEFFLSWVINFSKKTLYLFLPKRFCELYLLQSYCGNTTSIGESVWVVVVVGGGVNSTILSSIGRRTPLNEKLLTNCCPTEICVSYVYSFRYYSNLSKGWSQWDVWDGISTNTMLLFLPSSIISTLLWESCPSSINIWGRWSPIFGKNVWVNHNFASPLKKIYSTVKNLK